MWRAQKTNSRSQPKNSIRQAPKKSFTRMPLLDKNPACSAPSKQRRKLNRPVSRLMLKSAYESQAVSVKDRFFRWWLPGSDCLECTRPSWNSGLACTFAGLRLMKNMKNSGSIRFTRPAFFSDMPVRENVPNWRLPRLGECRV